MSYSELESGYQGLRKNRRGFYVGHDDDDIENENENENIISLVSNFVIFKKKKNVFVELRFRSFH